MAQLYHSRGGGASVVGGGCSTPNTAVRSENVTLYSLPHANCECLVCCDEVSGLFSLSTASWLLWFTMCVCVWGGREVPNRYWDVLG